MLRPLPGWGFAPYQGRSSSKPSGAFTWRIISTYAVEGILAGSFHLTTSWRVKYSRARTPPGNEAPHRLQANQSRY